MSSFTTLQRSREALLAFVLFLSLLSVGTNIYLYRRHPAPFKVVDTAVLEELQQRCMQEVLGDEDRQALQKMQHALQAKSKEYQESLQKFQAEKEQLTQDIRNSEEHALKVVQNELKSMLMHFLTQNEQIMAEAKEIMTPLVQKAKEQLCKKHGITSILFISNNASGLNGNEEHDVTDLFKEMIDKIIEERKSDAKAI